MLWQLHNKLQSNILDKDKKKKLADSIKGVSVNEMICCNIFEISSVP